MDFKPNEFFLGLVDFIAILLPGCLLTGVLLMVDATILKNKLYCFGLQSDTSVIFWVCYIFIAYTLGYFFSSIATGLDILFDMIKKQIYPYKLDIFKKYLKNKKNIDIKNESKENKKAIDAIKEAIKKGETTEANDFEAYCLQYVKDCTRQFFHFIFELETTVKIDRSLEVAIEIKERTLKGAERDLNAFQWGLLILDTCYPAAAEKANRTMAASKFFRSLVLVCVVSMLFQLAEWLPNTLPFWAWLGLTLLSFREYVVQRQKSIQAIYRGIITFYFLPDMFQKSKG